MSRLLREVGEAMYGGQWQTPLAADLGISDRHMRRMVAGDADLRPGMALDLLRLTQERALMLDALADRLRVAASPGLTNPTEDGRDD